MVVIISKYQLTSFGTNHPDALAALNDSFKSSNMAYNIKSEDEYLQVMEKIESYLLQATKRGGLHALSANVRDELHVLSKMAESWEDSVPLMPIKQPQTLVEMIELKMYERKLKQKELAELLEIAPSRLSEILKGKRQITLTMARNLYKKLDINPAFILEKAISED